MDNRKSILNRYQQLRSTSMELHNALMKQSRPPIQAAAEHLGVLIEGTITLDADQMPVLMDHALYGCWEEGRNAVGRFATEHPPTPESTEAVVLGAMQRAFFSVFQVDQIVPGLGVQVTDIFRDQQHFMVDVNLSQTAAPSLAVACRALPFDEFIISTGAILPLDAEAVRIVAAMLDEAGISPETLSSLPDETWSELEAIVIRTCLSVRDDHPIAYEDVPSVPLNAPPSSRATKVGRNAPCSCGSGKKYKHCCGR